MDNRDNGVLLWLDDIRDPMTDDWWYEIGSKLFNEWCLNSEEYNCEATK